MLFSLITSSTINTLVCTEEVIVLFDCITENFTTFRFTFGSGCVIRTVFLRWYLDVDVFGIGYMFALYKMFH